MKYLLVLLVVCVAVWMWRNNRITKQQSDRQSRQEDKKRETERDATQQTMVACAHCGVHLPQTEALATPGQEVAQNSAQKAWFCCAEHRQLGVKVS